MVIEITHYFIPFIKIITSNLYRIYPFYYPRRLTRIHIHASIVKLWVGQSWCGNRNKWCGFLQNNPKLLLEVHLLPLRQSPIKRVHQRGQTVQHHPLGHRNSGANSPPRPKWEVVEVVPAVVPASIGPGCKPLRVELQRIGPDGRVPVYGPNIDEYPGTLGDRVPADGTGLAVAVWDQKW